MLVRIWPSLCASPRRAALSFGALAFLLALPGLGELGGLGHPDEQFYLSVAVDSFDHRAIAPTHDGVPFFAKPPLVFWASEAALAVFGRNGYAARLPGALAAALTVAAGVIFAAELVGGASAAGALAGALLLGSLGVMRFGRELMLDLPLEACLAFGLWGFAAAARGRRWPGVVAGFCLALSLGFKGPVGVALLGLAAVIALAWERSLGPLVRQWFWLGLVVGSAVVLPWYVWALKLHPSELAHFQLHEQYLERFVTAHGQSPWNLLWGTLLYAAPFWPFSVTALFRRPAVDTRVVWIAAWLGSFYGIYVLPKEHGLHYPVLALVPLAALAAVTDIPRMLRIAIGATVAIGACAVALTAAFPEVSRLLAVAVAALGLLAAIGFAGRTPQSLVLGSVLTAACGNLAFAGIAPALGRPLMTAEAATVGGGARVGVLNEHPGPYRLAGPLGPDTRELWGEGDLRTALDQGTLILTKESHLDEIDPLLVQKLQPLAIWRRTRGYLDAPTVWDAWKARDLDSLGEWYGLYRLRETPP